MSNLLKCFSIWTQKRFSFNFQHQKKEAWFIRQATEIHSNVFLLHLVCIRARSLLSEEYASIFFCDNEFILSFEWNEIFMVFFVQCHTGPGSYTVANSTLDKTKAFSFGSRHEPKVRSDTPAPNQYATEKCNFNRQPSFTFGERRNVEKKSDTPGKKNAQFHQSTENAQTYQPITWFEIFFHEIFQLLARIHQKNLNQKFNPVSHLEDGTLPINRVKLQVSENQSFSNFFQKN